MSQSAFSTLPPIAAGALATATLMYPVDLLRALNMANATGPKMSTTQLVQKFLKEHGVAGLFKQGVFPEMARATWMRVLKFFLFPIVHKEIYGTAPSQGTPYTKAMCGALASIPETMSIAPIELAKIGLQLDSTNRFKNSGAAVAKHILAERGPKGWLIGYFGVQYRQATWTAAYFASLGSFSKATKPLAESVFSDPGTVEKAGQIIGGFGAGVFGAIFNTPGDVIRTNIQKAALAETGKKEALSVGYMVSGVTDFFAMGGQIAKNGGVGALYKGFGFKAMHLGGSGSLLAVLIPTFKKLMGVDRE